jgi:hypothetical protein
MVQSEMETRISAMEPSDSPITSSHVYCLGSRGCSGNNWTCHIPVHGIAPVQSQRISCVYGLIARNDLVR